MTSRIPTDSSRLKVRIVTAALPPQLDGIGDHSSKLASALSDRAEIQIQTIRGFSPDPIPGVQIFQSFNIDPRKDVSDLSITIDEHPADWLILQYNPFCFGKRGFNPYLAATFRRIKRQHPQTKIAVMVHERFMPGNSIRNAIVWMYQCLQFRAITAAADVTLFSTGPWADAYRRWYPDRKCIHMPVGSNLPYVPSNRGQVRAEIGIRADEIVLGSFGGNHPSRLFNLLAASGRRLKSLGREVRILCIGSAGSAIKEMMPDLPLIDLSQLPEAHVSRYLAAMDIYISPFFDGVSTRRGSFFAGIQHGLPTVTTRGYNTDADLISRAGAAFLATAANDETEFVNAVVRLADDRDLRNAIGNRAKICFDKYYSLPVLADHWYQLVQGNPRGAGG